MDLDSIAAATRVELPVDGIHLLVNLLVGDVSWVHFIVKRLHPQVSQDDAREALFSASCVVVTASAASMSDDNKSDALSGSERNPNSDQ